jgi:hypothetical protein
MGISWDGGIPNFTIDPELQRAQEWNSIKTEWQDMMKETYVEAFSPDSPRWQIMEELAMSQAKLATAPQASQQPVIINQGGNVNLYLILAVAGVGLFLILKKRGI